MRRVNWNDLRDGLRERNRAPEPRDADEFWADFRRRSGSQAAPTPLAVVPRLAWAAAAAVALVAALSGVRVALSPAASSPPPLAASNVEEVEVMVSHTSMMIMQDDEAAIVWVTDMAPATKTDYGG